MSPDVSARQRKRLEDAGCSLVEFRSGKSLWRRPDGGRLYTGCLYTLKSALKHVNRQEGTAYGCRPDGGYLYAQEAALEIVRRTDRGETS